MRLLHGGAVALVSVVLLVLIGWPNQTVTTVAGTAEPWDPLGRGTPAIDVLGSSPWYGELYGDVTVVPRGNHSRQGVSGVRLADGAESWVYERRWADDMLEPIRVDDRHVAVPWRDGHVTLIDVPTGDIVWQTDLPDGPFAPENRTLDEEWPTAWELSVARHGSTSALVVLHDGRVDVLDTRSGAIRWSRHSGTCPGAHGTEYPGVGSVKGAGTAVLISRGCEGTTGYVVALSTEDGRPLWRFTERELNPLSSRDLGEGRFVSAADGGLVVRRTVDGKILWRARPADHYVEDYGVSVGLLTVPHESGITAYRVADGSVAWRRDVRDGGRPDVLTNGLVTYATSTPRTLLKLDARTGRVIDRHRFDKDIELKSMDDDLVAIGFQEVGTGDDQLIG
ncbi:PQQ-binding-like beta-propeller repeat protein [Nonomuraea longicatena]|uniref:Pyrrolo-quinoline quinone repeat domain-containing protein n=1 Tax=Nonomuraea longicatena TaxID=83682 RepID=A0ABP4AST5_9ACTN